MCVCVPQFEEVWELLGRFETLVTTRDQLRQREIEVQEQVDSLRGALQRYTDQQSCLLVHNNNLLSQLQSQLDQARSDALRWVGVRHPQSNTEQTRSIGFLRDCRWILIF